jgi:hypothetical protein
MTKNKLIIGQVKFLGNCNPLRFSLTSRLGQLVRVGSALASLLLVAMPSLASDYFFSTGDPDGKMATASRPGPGPGSGANQETESADDFVLDTYTFINSATFTGLIPADASLSDVAEVRVEIYRVFPKDSDVTRTPRVPTRENSPSDVEFDDRDSGSSNLTFAMTLLNPSFMTGNSVDTGIHAAPDQTTGGDGAVTGQEVQFNVTFTTPFYLPPDHYFFVPQVLLNNPDSHFLWLSAPKPIVAPGTPFDPDLQEWVRNADLDPDWLRVATDIVGAPPAFNATFSLAGDLDTDADQVPDSLDQCPDTVFGAIVNAEGCSLDQLVPCSGPVSGGSWKNHGAYVSSFSHTAESFVEQGLISEEDADALVAAAAQSSCGAKAK